MRAVALLMLSVLALAGCAATHMVATPATPVNGPELPKVAPPSFTGIGEFSLGMPIAPLVAKLGTADQSGKDEQGGVYHAFKIQGGYMVLLTAPFRPDYVYGVQITGGAEVQMAPFGGLHLGDKQELLRARFGLPTEKQKETGNDLTLWTYGDRNYSFEVTSDGMLASIQVYGYAGVMTAEGWQPNWEKYVPDSIAGVIEKDSAGIREADIYVPAGGVRFRPRVVYTGEVRDTPPAVMQVISNWMQSTPVNLTPDRYLKSMKFLEGGKEYWLPVQDTVVTELQTHAQKGQALDLFAIWVGASGKGAVETVIVNEYCSCSWGPEPVTK